jgi:hypothetical protein
MIFNVTMKISATVPRETGLIPGTTTRVIVLTCQSRTILIIREKAKVLQEEVHGAIVLANSLKLRVQTNLKGEIRTGCSGSKMIIARILVVTIASQAHMGISIIAI